MIRLIYFSSASYDISEEELLEILEVSRTKNKENNITGMLLYLSGNIIQVLEGDKDKVEETYKRIEKDERHHGCIIADDEEIKERSFPNWSMGFRYYNEENINELEGFSEFINKKMNPEDVSKNANVYELLYSFKNNNR